MGNVQSFFCTEKNVVKKCELTGSLEIVSVVANVDLIFS